MREILFRGKCKDTGKWYIGQYINLHKTTYCFKEDYEADKENEIHRIVFEEMTDWGLPNRHLQVDVIPETVGQYTGLTDKNGTKIFEGDIVRDKTNGVVYKIFYCNESGMFIRKAVLRSSLGNPLHLEVIGNIHDNPELLGGGEG
jgi:uncharacterized phage protein (TIGR01671 family)